MQRILAVAGAQQPQLVPALRGSAWVAAAGGGAAAHDGSGGHAASTSGGSRLGPRAEHGRGVGGWVYMELLSCLAHLAMLPEQWLVATDAGPESKLCQVGTAAVPAGAAASVSGSGGGDSRGSSRGGSGGGRREGTEGPSAHERPSRLLLVRRLLPRPWLSEVGGLAVGGRSGWLAGKAVDCGP